MRNTLKPPIVKGRRRNVRVLFVNSPRKIVFTFSI